MLAQEGTDPRLNRGRQIGIDVHLADVERDSWGSLPFVCLPPRAESLFSHVADQGLALFTAVIFEAHAQTVEPRHAKHHVA